MAVLLFDAELTNVSGVGARLAVRADQHLPMLHDAIQEAFGWEDDHLYSFWLDGHFWGERAQEYTSPVVPTRRRRRPTSRWPSSTSPPVRRSPTCSTSATSGAFA